MTISHTYDGTCIAPASRRPAADITGLFAAIRGRATHFFAALQQQWTMQRIARFSDHRLHDIGFERDWDGSVNWTRGRSTAARCGH